MPKKGYKQTLQHKRAREISRRHECVSPSIPSLCHCGCGEIVYNGNIYINGHNARGKHLPKTDIQKKKLSTAMKGRVPWNKGKKCPELSEEHKKKISWLGRKHTNETKQKMTLSQTGEKNHNYGKKLPEYHKKKLLEAWKGKHHTEESKRVMSEAQRGELCYNWRGGVSRFPYSLDFDKRLKLAVRERDGYTCQLCGKSEGISIDEFGRVLTIHHINHNKEDSRMENLISLCCSCNTKVSILTVKKHYESLLPNISEHGRLYFPQRYE